MATKMKGLFKGIKYISQIFVYKEHEMEIGYPTDVRHVAHIGWDGGGAAMNAPSWMNEFKTVSDFSTATVNNFGQARDPGCVAVARWPVQDFQQASELQHAAGIVLDSHNTEQSGNPKKPRRKKPKNPCSPSKAKRTSSSSSSSRYSRSKSSLTVQG